MATPAASPDSGPDAALIQRAAAGDRAAYGDLYRQYAGMVHGILLTRVPPAEADDLTQDVFLKAMKELHKLRDSAAFGPWLAAMARNRACDFHRGQRSRWKSLDSDAIPVIGSRPVAEGRRVFEIIKTLPESYRETLLLRLLEGMTGPEISHRTGLTPGSVRVNLSRGMQLLREKLGGHL